VTNTGDRAGDEVVQLYVHDAHASVTRPVKELKGFKRIGLAPGETQTVTFVLDARQLGFYDQHMAYVVEPGTIEVMLGGSSQDIRLCGSFAIAGDVTEIAHDKVFFSAASVQ
jgi:beta-glucosidase